MDIDKPCLPEHSVTTLEAIHCLDWRVLLAALPAQSVDLTITDTPYGTTACSWDTVIDLAHWWREMRRVMKPRGAVVMTASQPYTSALVMSNPAWFRYEWIWHKPAPVGFLDARRKPLDAHETILVFAAASPPYYPQGLTAVYVKSGSLQKTKPGGVYGRVGNPDYINTEGNFPRTVIEFGNGLNNKVHPTQKPVALFEYLIRTYTHEHALVLDPFCGSGTTAVAARNTKRRYICGDISAEYVAIARDRVRVEPFAPIVADDDVSDLPLFAA